MRKCYIKHPNKGLSWQRCSAKCTVMRTGILTHSYVHWVLYVLVANREYEQNKTRAVRVRLWTSHMRLSNDPGALGCSSTFTKRLYLYGQHTRARTHTHSRRIKTWDRREIPRREFIVGRSECGWVHCTQNATHIVCASPKRGAAYQPDWCLQLIAN